MISFNRKNVTVLTLSILLITLPIVSYIKFVEYKPDISENLQEVKGTKEGPISNFPFPKEYKEIRVDNTPQGKQVTIEVNKTPQEIQTFYKISLMSEGWEITQQTDSNSVLSTEFRKNNLKTTVTSAINEKFNKTIVIIEVSL